MILLDTVNIYWWWCIISCRVITFGGLGVRVVWKLFNSCITTTTTTTTTTNHNNNDDDDDKYQ